MSLQPIATVTDIPDPLPNCAHINWPVPVGSLDVTESQWVQCSLHLDTNTLLLHTHVSVILCFHKILQPSHQVCSVETCRVLVVITATEHNNKCVDYSFIHI
jgi:hypothetical protein